jgi:hypothetical protein
MSRHHASIHAVRSSRLEVFASLVTSKQEAGRFERAWLSAMGFFLATRMKHP